MQTIFYGAAGAAALGLMMGGAFKMPAAAADNMPAPVLQLTSYPVSNAEAPEPYSIGYLQPVAYSPASSDTAYAADYAPERGESVEDLLRRVAYDPGPAPSSGDDLAEAVPAPVPADDPTPYATGMTSKPVYETRAQAESAADRASDTSARTPYASIDALISDLKDQPSPS